MADLRWSGVLAASSRAFGWATNASVFHAPPEASGALPTAEVFVAPFAELLVEGQSDQTLRPQQDATEAATVLFNTAGWGYVQLRHAQRWPTDRARAGVRTLVMAGPAAPED